VQKAFGTWPSPITADIVASQGIRLSSVVIDGDDIYWIEGRPQESGRNVLVRRRTDGSKDVTPADFNVRTRVHEYGGGACIVSGGVIYASSFADQRIYRLDSAGSHKPIPLTPDGRWFYADATLDERRRRLIVVREDHSDPNREPVNTLVSISIDGPASAGEVIASGFDFYSTPRLSPDASRLAWLAWRHPQMPWDGTELWIAGITEQGTLVDATRVAGGDAESIYQPGWTPDGQLYFVSDRDGWWKLYRLRKTSSVVVANAPPGAEFGRPQWVFGTASWAPAGEGRLLVSYTNAGRWHLGLLDTTSGVLTGLADLLEPREWLAANDTHAVVVAGSASTPDAVVRIELATGAIETIKSSSAVDIADSFLSTPESVEFSSPDGHTSHAFYYPPRSGDYDAPDGERPPLILISHGGPTTATSAMLDLRVQFWTSRGFAVADVNYGGSSGFGRASRQRLNGQWGIVDVDDMVAAARFLVAAGNADPNRLAIRGGSAGGYTTLAALTFRPGVFQAGASYYGVSDIEVLARDTHKFESRYLDTLIGPYPAARDVYRARSPIHFVDRLSCSLILFQGLEDKVVPPNQSEMMAAAVRAKGLPVAYLAFEGEQHGFRKASTIVRCLEAELLFYGRVFGFTPTDQIAPFPIDNL
jgi:dipeptidyl aminopeptidase/acylaminoacyl peptidase